jgi:protein-S-isoprenylcysteine O-methyltransferase Ste14
MELSTVVMIVSLTGVFVQIDPFFRSPLYLGFVFVYVAWALVNVWLILRLPVVAPVRTVPKPQPAMV